METRKFHICKEVVAHDISEAIAKEGEGRIVEVSAVAGGETQVSAIGFRIAGESEL